MGRWDRELIEQLPKSVKVYASAGAGFDWVDTDILAEFGKCVECAFLSFFPSSFFLGGGLGVGGGKCLVKGGEKGGRSGLSS